ncbi:Non-specific serine/threonine protein kinase [Purpureocillium takamizusanense]|uniref:non-specific serine/threonine protein kinase n=1 Tax=Purpureocillium takamizusanense TaxID=2060973 RepID=A0A9Q8Q734_9HYPO|nr:Non-specific serine/threonine protein kinase [Purpureocillium takamizusanense]UNI14280.1 Non-specific serine/threonine protein kinase [Purpureocillium takamizusanense]
MPRTTTARKYGKPSKRSRAERMFAELPQSPVRKPPASVSATSHDPIRDVTELFSAVRIDEEPVAASPRRSSRKSIRPACVVVEDDSRESSTDIKRIEPRNETLDDGPVDVASEDSVKRDENKTTESSPAPDNFSGNVEDTSLRILTWDDVCPPGDRVVKIAEASYAEVYRVTNERGTSIIKVIRLDSPIKAQTKQQIKAGLVDEDPRCEDDVNGELQISEWLADIPGFVVYKEKYVVQGKATKQLLETHQIFQRRMKRQDPGRAQFYPSPSRYLDETKFLVVELGDAGTALEDWELADERELWDIFFLEAIALARAEETAMFEHRDLHEGNLCVKRVRPARERTASSTGFFGFSGLDITILDYGLSRAEDLSVDYAKPVAFDLERELGLFTSTHASQCTVYRRMRSFLLRGDRKCIPAEGHRTPYAWGIDGPLSWEVYAPYTNVLWLAYLYEHLLDSFGGSSNKNKKKDTIPTEFQEETTELWKHLNPEADESVPCFGSAADIVCFAVESGWISAEQLHGASASMLDREDSIIVSREDGDGDGDASLRRSPRRRKGGPWAA